MFLFTLQKLTTITIYTLRLPNYIITVDDFATL